MLASLINSHNSHLKLWFIRVFKQFEKKSVNNSKTYYLCQALINISFN